MIRLPVIVLFIANYFGMPCCFCLLQSVLRRRDAIQMEYDMLLEELCRKKDDSSEVDVILLSEMEYIILLDLISCYAVFTCFC